MNNKSYNFSATNMYFSAVVEYIDRLLQVNKSIIVYLLIIYIYMHSLSIPGMKMSEDSLKSLLCFICTEGISALLEN